MKRICVLLIVIVILLTFGACQNPGSKYGESSTSDIESQVNTNGEGDKNMELTQRQQEILKKEGLPIEYAQLNDSQKKSIVAIEEMFLYLDEKYDTTFEYVGYRAASSVDKETLIVQVKGGTSADNFSVIRDDGVCSDNYGTVFYRDAYEAMIKAQFQNEFSLVEVFSEIEEVADVTEPTDLRTSVIATSGVYIAESNIKDRAIRDIASDFAYWYAEKSGKNSCSFAVYIIPDETYWSITRFNRTNYNDKIISKINITIKADGSVVVK